MIRYLLALLSVSISALYTMHPPLEKKISKQQFNKAVKRNKPSLVKAYLESENPDPKSLYRQLHCALDHNAKGSVALLLRYGVPVNMPYNPGFPTPIMKMTEQANLEMVIWLKAMMANIKIENKEGKNPLEIAMTKWENAPANSAEEKLYYDIFHELSLFTLFTRMRQHLIQVPKELWDHDTQR